MKERIVTNPGGSKGRVFALTKSEVMTLCRPGAGPDTCIWLVCGKDGFDCLCYDRRVPSLTGEILEDRWQAGLTVAKRDGCDEIRKYSLKNTE